MNRVTSGQHLDPKFERNYPGLAHVDAHQLKQSNPDSGSKPGSFTKSVNRSFMLFIKKDESFRNRSCQINLLTIVASKSNKEFSKNILMETSQIFNWWKLFIIDRSTSTFLSMEACKEVKL